MTNKSQMRCNKLKLNGNKTKSLHFHPDHKHNHSNLITAIKIGSDVIAPSREARNLGVIFDDDLYLRNHITCICKSANFQLYGISHVKKYLSNDALKTAVHSWFSDR